MNQLQKRFSNSFERHARKGSERGTKYIYLLIGIFVALFLQAFVHNYNIVYMALFFTFAFAYTGGLFGRRNIRALELKLFSMQRAFVNQKSVYTLHLSSNSERDIYDITCYSQDKKKHLNNISSSKSSLLELEHQHHSRGAHTLTTVRCESFFPLPHQFFFKVFDINKNYDVYPEPKGKSLESFLARKEVNYADIEDQEGLKEYVHGDKISHIHWKSLAKGKGLQSKEFSYSDDQNDLIFDFERCERDDEARLSQLCLWVLECEKFALEFIIMMPYEKIESSKWSSDEILKKLARY